MRVALLVALLSVAGPGSQLALAAGENAQNLPGLMTYQAPKFPIGLRGAKMGDGYVVITMTIDAQGQVSDSFALAANHDAFVQSATEAIADWRFAPTASTTAPRRETVEFEFKRLGVVTTLSHGESASAAFMSTNIERKTVQWHELDAEPKRIAARMPAVSKSSLKKLGAKPLMLNYIIDDQGRVRIPVISESDDAELSERVLAAVRQWRYSSPLYKGKPMAVEVTRSLVLPQ